MADEILYKTIGDVAEELKVNESAIRYWQKAFPSVIDPLRRSGNRRCYTDEDIAVLKVIKTQLFDYKRTISELQTAIAGGYLADMRKPPRQSLSDAEPTLFSINSKTNLKADDVAAVVKDLQNVKSALDSLL